MRTEQHELRRAPSRDTDPSVWAGIGVVALLVGAMVAFVAAPWVLPDTYRWTEDGISESAAQGVDGAWVARAGFILFGLGVLWLVQIRRRSWGPAASVLHGSFAVCMFAVAAFSTKSWEEGASYVESEDSLHDMFASIMGFSFVAALVTLIVIRRDRRARGAVPDWVALVIAAAVPLAIDSDVWGVLQRVMFLTAVLWYSREALLAR